MTSEAQPKPAAPTSIWWRGIRPDPAIMNKMGSDSLAKLIGIELVDVGDDWLSARMPVDARTHQPWGRLHGGASVVLAETLGSFGASSTLDPERFIAVGLEINANHVRPVRTGWVMGIARPEARGRTTQVWSIRITDEADKLVCISRLTLSNIPLERN